MFPFGGGGVGVSDWLRVVTGYTKGGTGYMCQFIVSWLHIHPSLPNFVIDTELDPVNIFPLQHQAFQLRALEWHCKAIVRKTPSFQVLASIVTSEHSPSSPSDV